MVDYVADNLTTINHSFDSSLGQLLYHMHFLIVAIKCVSAVLSSAYIYWGCDQEHATIFITLYIYWCCKQKKTYHKASALLKPWIQSTPKETVAVYGTISQYETF